jgi:hypothetical protein
MNTTNRREFVFSSLATLGTAATCGTALGKTGPKAKMPTVKWGRHEISRLLVGHNPLKGQSYTNGTLDKEMRAWYDPKQGHDVELLVRCREAGINTCQVGGGNMEDVLRRFYAKGGTMQWISTFYARPGQGGNELKRILKMDPKPIGAQQWGQVSDDLLAAGKLDQVTENLKLLRDSGLLVGLGAHNPRVIEYAEEKGFDVDFYQCCFYYTRHGEMWNDKERQRMVEVMRRASKPCIGFKVLAGNHLTKTPQDVYDALQFAFDHIKPTDVVLVGIWQKSKDQVEENARSVAKILHA